MYLYVKEIQHHLNDNKYTAVLYGTRITILTLSGIMYSNKNYGKPKETKIGVPQCKVIGPILVLLYRLCCLKLIVLVCCNKLHRMRLKFK